MTTEQNLQLVLAIVGGLFGAGGIAALVGHLVTRKLGLKTNENEANKVINTTWEAIVDDLQAQIKDGRDEFTKQLTNVYGKLEKLEERVQKQDEELHLKDRLLLAAIRHIGALEALIPPPAPERPKGLE